MDKAIVKVDSMEEPGRPETGRETGTVEEGTNFHCQGIVVVVYLDAAVLRGTVCAGGFDDVSEIFEHGVAEDRTPSEFSTLVRSNEPRTGAIFRHKRPENFNRRLL